MHLSPYRGQVFLFSLQARLRFIPSSPNHLYMTKPTLTSVLVIVSGVVMSLSDALQYDWA